MATKKILRALAEPRCVGRRHQKGLPQAGNEIPPDRNLDSKEAEEKFKEIKEAYEILSDSQKRAATTNTVTLA